MKPALGTFLVLAVVGAAVAFSGGCREPAPHPTAEGLPQWQNSDPVDRLTEYGQDRVDRLEGALSQLRNRSSRNPPDSFEQAIDETLDLRTEREREAAVKGAVAGGVGVGLLLLLLL